MCLQFCPFGLPEHNRSLISTAHDMQARLHDVAGAATELLNNAVPCPSGKGVPTAMFMIAAEDVDALRGLLLELKFSGAVDR